MIIVHAMAGQQMHGHCKSDFMRLHAMPALQSLMHACQKLSSSHTTESIPAKFRISLTSLIAPSARYGDPQILARVQNSDGLLTSLTLATFVLSCRNWGYLAQKLDTSSQYQVHSQKIISGLCLDQEVLAFSNFHKWWSPCSTLPIFACEWPLAGALHQA